MKSVEVPHQLCKSCISLDSSDCRLFDITVYLVQHERKLKRFSARTATEMHSSYAKTGTKYAWSALTPRIAKQSTEYCLLAGIKMEFLCNSFLGSVPTPNSLPSQRRTDLAFILAPLVACHAAHWTCRER
jgi:hypothetical protein